jgi:hypothetical protein
MTGKRNRKPVAKAVPEQLMWDEIDGLARALAVDLMCEKPQAIRLLLLLTHEIGFHSFDQSHVETISGLMRDHLFNVTPESDTAEGKLIAEIRAEFQKGGEGR